MAKLFRASRMRALVETRFGRYLAYATGEILLIFLGITLALLFSNWNEERDLRRAELTALGEIASNLRANVGFFEENIQLDQSSLSDCEEIVELIEGRAPWSSRHSPIMYNCRTWTSPYLHDAAYESLRLRGTDLIENSDVKNSIVSLFENEYEQLYGDIDWSQKTFEAAVWGLSTPVFSSIEVRKPLDLATTMRL